MIGIAIAAVVGISVLGLWTLSSISDKYEVRARAEGYEEGYKAGFAEGLRYSLEVRE